MESELNLLLGRAINSLTKLEMLFYLRGRPKGVQPAKDIATSTHRDPAEVVRALEELARVGLIDRFAIGTGKHVMYGPAEDPHVRDIIYLLHDRYHKDGDSRAQIRQEILGELGPAQSDSTPDSS